MPNITSALVTAGADKLASVLQDAAAKPAAPLSDFHAATLAKEVLAQAAATPAVQDAIAAALPQPIDWWKSQAIVGNVVALMLAVTAIVVLFQTGTASAETLSVPVGALLANGFALYGRITTTRPIAGTAAAEAVANRAA